MIALLEGRQSESSIPRITFSRTASEFQQKMAEIRGVICNIARNLMSSSFTSVDSLFSVQTIKRVDNHSERQEWLEVTHHAQRSRLQVEWDWFILFLIPNIDILLVFLNSSITATFLIACCLFAVVHPLLSLAKLVGTSYPFVSAGHVHIAFSLSLQYSRSTRTLFAQFLRQIVILTTNALAIVAFTDYFSMVVLVYWVLLECCSPRRHCLNIRFPWSMKMPFPFLLRFVFSGPKLSKWWMYYGLDLSADRHRRSARPPSAPHNRHSVN
jgi:hypothetical protein